jgi:hypothetical protein
MGRCSGSDVPGLEYAYIDALFGKPGRNVIDLELSESQFRHLLPGFSLSVRLPGGVVPRPGRLRPRRHPGRSAFPTVPAGTVARGPTAPAATGGLWGVARHPRLPRRGHRPLQPQQRRPGPRPMAAPRHRSPLPLRALTILRSRFPSAVAFTTRCIAIERTISWLTGYRRLNHRYECNSRNYLAFLGLAAALCCYKRLVRLTHRMCGTLPSYLYVDRFPSCFGRSRHSRRAPTATRALERGQPRRCRRSPPSPAGAGCAGCIGGLPLPQPRR